MSINKILVLGKTGEGKSTLYNYIADYKEKKIKESNKSGSCTKNVEGCISNIYKYIFMIDSPGLSDSSGEDQKIVDKIKSAIKDKHCQGIKSIILVTNITVNRLSFDDQKLLKIYCKIFPFLEFWYHVGIVFSNSFEYFPDKALNDMKQAKQNDYLKNLTAVVEETTNELNKYLPSDKQIHIPGVFQTFYRDCGEILPGFNHNKTDKEIERLINWERGNTYLDFFKNDFNSKMSIEYISKVPAKDRVNPPIEEIMPYDKNEKKNNNLLL